MSTVLWVKLGSTGSSRVPCEKISFRVRRNVFQFLGWVSAVSVM